MSDNLKELNARLRGTIPWKLLSQHIEDLITEALSGLGVAREPTELWRLQGELGRLIKLRNLPETLALKHSKEE